MEFSEASEGTQIRTHFYNVLLFIKKEQYKYNFVCLIVLYHVTWLSYTLVTHICTQVLAISFYFSKLLF